MMKFLKCYWARDFDGKTEVYLAKDVIEYLEARAPAAPPSGEFPVEDFIEWCADNLRCDIPAVQWEYDKAANWAWSRALSARAGDVSILVEGLREIVKDQRLTLIKPGSQDYSDGANSAFCSQSENAAEILAAYEASVKGRDDET